MPKTKDDIYNGINTGFLNSEHPSKLIHRPTLLLNDQNSGKKVLSFLLRELKSCNEFWFSVAFLTKGGLMTLINTLKKTNEENIQGKILVSQYLNFTQPQALRMLLKFSNIETRIVTNGNFHSKGYLFKKCGHCKIVIGSSNLTANALSTNKELNIALSATNESQILIDLTQEFQSEFESSEVVDEMFIESYQVTYDEVQRKSQIYNLLDEEPIESENENLRVAETQTDFVWNKVERSTERNQVFRPNKMQIEALGNLTKLRDENVSKALVISATGTGKTFLSCFDAQNLGAKRLLFVVHRRTIALKAMETFKKVFGTSRSYGVFSGDQKELNADFLFATVQTLSKPENYRQFDASHFDYIVLDETHRAGAKSYQPIFDYFKPTFLLGMTATPERTDGYNIFEKFDHNVAHEIRLHDAMSEEMLCPFHYFGISDLIVDGQELDDKSLFKKLTTDQRVDHIIENITFYGTDNDTTRGLVFCSTNEESEYLSNAFNMRGFNTIALSGNNSEKDRLNAIRRLETSDESLKLDYIFTVDIFNEGIDIPSLNQIVMLRPTQSAIVFVQQLGRGLRKNSKKKYLTVLDFIGNYQSNYLVPVALYGDRSYSKDTLRKLMASGSGLIPGSSTINFDEITEKKIYEAIDQVNLQTKRDLVKDYNLLKYKLGRIPKMLDFVTYDSRDPQLYVQKAKSYFNFVAGQETELAEKILDTEKYLLELFDREINNTKRIVESFILQQLLGSPNVTIDEISSLLLQKYDVSFLKETILSACSNLNFSFVTDKKNKKLLSVQEIHDFEIIKVNDNRISIGETLKKALENDLFKEYLFNSIEYATRAYDQKFDRNLFIDGFSLYEKYSRKDVFRILNWERNPVAQNVGGYIISKDKTNCPIFVNYHKDDDISDTTKYEDRFLSHSRFEWMSKSRRTLKSPDVIAIKNAKKNMRLPLFVKKHNDEGKEFYYIGELAPIESSFEQTTMPSGNSEVKVVKVEFGISPHVEESIYEYISGT